MSDVEHSGPTHDEASDTAPADGSDHYKDHKKESAANEINRVLSSVEEQLRRHSSPRTTPRPETRTSDVPSRPRTVSRAPSTPHDDAATGPGLFESTWRHRWLVLLFTAIGLIGAVLVATLQPPTFETTALLRLDDSPRPAFTGQDLTDTESFVARQVDLIMSRRVVDEAIDLLGGGIDRDALDRSVDVEGDGELLTIEITAAAGSPERAAQIADSLAVAYQNVLAERYESQAQERIEELETSEQALQERIAQLEDQLQVEEGEELPPLSAARLQSLVDQLIAVEGQIQSISIEAASVGSGVRDFESAPIESSPAAPKPLLLALLGLMLGGGLGVAAAYWRAGRATRVWSASEAARLLGAPLLGRLPRLRATGEDLDRVLSIDPAEREAFAFLLTSLEYALVEVDGSRLMITSATPRQGKTTATIHLGLAAEDTELRVLLVDGDLRSRRLSSLFEMEDVPGLSELDQAVADGVAEMIEQEERRLTIVPAGRDTRRAPAFLHAEQFRDDFRRLTRTADLVLVDSAPVLATAETTLMSSLVDGIVLLVPARSSAHELIRAKERTSFMSSPLLGFVFVGDDRGGGDAAYGYYGEHHDPEHEDPNRYAERVRQLVGHVTGSRSRG